MNAMAAAAWDVYINAASDPESVKDAYCDVIKLMRARGWPPERALVYCKRASTAEGRTRMDSVGESNRRLILQARLVDWLIDCYFDG